MKKFIFSFILLSICIKMFSQNYIPNGSFENIDSIPYYPYNNYAGQISFANPWYGWNSDIYSQLSLYWSTPSNHLGYSVPKTGKNYAGLAFLYGNFIGLFTNYSVTEVIDIKLTKPLIAYQTYSISFYINLADSSNYAIDYFSVFFSSDSLLPNDANFPLLPVLRKYQIKPQLSYKGLGIVYDTTNWTQIDFTYIANGTEKYFHLGGFLDSVDKSNYAKTNNTSLEVAYYFVDDISIYEIDTLPPQADAGVDQTICWGDSAKIGSHAYSDYYYRWKAGLQSGFSPSMDSGRIWVAPKYTTTYVLECTDFRYEKSYDTITVKVELCGLSGKKHLICKGDSLKLNDTLVNAYRHQWTPDAFLSSDTLQSPICYAKSDIAYLHLIKDANDSIIQRDTVIVKVVNCAQARAGHDTTICLFDSLQIGLENSSFFSYQWSPDQNLEWPFDGITTAWPNQSTAYILVVTDTLGNMATDTLNVKVKLCKLPPEIIIPNVFTPNGDNFNEVFRFKNEEYWHLKVEIYNRWGYLLFTGDENTHWDATYEGNKVSDGVYFYSIDAWVEGLDKVLEYRGTITVMGK
jgi:gliding motility-associated-like protein